MCNLTKKQMLDKVIRKYGFEASQTIKFAKLIEKRKAKDNYVKQKFKILIERT